MFYLRNPALNAPRPTGKQWQGVACLGFKTAFLVAFMFVLSVMSMSRVSPFLYFQF